MRIKQQDTMNSRTWSLRICPRKREYLSYCCKLSSFSSSSFSSCHVLLMLRGVCNCKTCEGDCRVLVSALPRNSFRAFDFCITSTTRKFMSFLCCCSIFLQPPLCSPKIMNINHDSQTPPLHPMPKVEHRFDLQGH